MATNGMKGGLGKFWEFVQTIGAGAGILALQHIVSEALLGAKKKANRTENGNILSSLGLNSESTKKLVDYEIFFRSILLKITMKPEDKKSHQGLAWPSQRN